MAAKKLTDPTVGLLDVVKKCPFCQAGLNKGLTYYVDEKTDLKPKHKLLCRCGWISRGYEDLAGLVQWFNTRGGRKFEIPEMNYDQGKSAYQAQIVDDKKVASPDSPEEVF